MAAYSCTPPTQSYLASNPLARAAPIPLKRPPSLKAGSSSAAIGISLPPSSTGARLSSSTVPLPAAPEGSSVSSAQLEELYRNRYSLSASGARRRSIASSPTVSESPAKGQQASTATASSFRPATAVFGFDAAGPFGPAPAAPAPAVSGFSFAPVPLAVPAVRPQRAAGLLSKAFSTEPLAPLGHSSALLQDASPSSSPSSASSLGQDTSLFFPGIDMRPLRAAQAHHAIFRNELVVTAYSVAAQAHKHQFRKNGDPIIDHCVEVAKLLAGLGLDAETVAAGLLHEVLAGDLNRSQLMEFMPTSVVRLVDSVENISSMSRLYRQHASAFNDDKFSRMLVAMEDVRAVLVKLADRVHNMRTIRALPLARQEALARETLEVYSVVANRLGIWCVKAELEDLAFSILHPEDYAFLKDAVRERQDPVALEATINKIKGALQAHGVSYEDISGRPKNLYGVWSKLRKDGKPLTSESLATVYDLVALRVVVANKHDCYVALRSVQSVYRAMADRSKDFIKDIRKPNGYQSLHETVYGEGGAPVEVQIRTHKMHYIAEYGFAAHWKYKEALCSEDEWLEKETQYKRWLTQYKLGVHDKKVRPQGSPPTDGSLKSLGVAFLDRPDAADGAGRAVVDPFLRNDRFRLHPPAKSEVSVLLATQDSVEAKQFPLGTTAHQLWSDLGLGSLPGYALTVNSRLPAGEAALQSGDLIQIVPLSQLLGSGRSGGSGLGLGLAPLATGRSSGGSDEDDDVLEVFGLSGRSSLQLGGRAGSSAAAAAAVA